MQYVQFGCGWKAPTQWVNFDASPTLRFERIPILGRLYKKNQERFPKNVIYGDIVAGLPVPDESCDGLYASHVLEHLSLADLRPALSNSLKILKPSAKFRIVVPDLEYYVQAYLHDQSAGAALKFLTDSGLGRQDKPRTPQGLLKYWLGNSDHLWMWDFKSIELELTRVGFSNVRRAQMGDSGDNMFSHVEDKSRWENCLGLEAVRPA